MTDQSKVWTIYAVVHSANAIVLGLTAFAPVFGVLPWWRFAGASVALCPPSPARVNAREQAAA